MTNREPANRAAMLARPFGCNSTRIVVRVGMTLSMALGRRGPIKRWLRKSAIVACYRRADAIIANSDGVAKDISVVTGIPLSSIHVIHNPTVSREMFLEAEEPVDHPWFGPGGPPVILGVGRLARQKDFADPSQGVCETAVETALPSHHSWRREGTCDARFHWHPNWEYRPDVELRGTCIQPLLLHEAGDAFCPLLCLGGLPKRPDPGHGPGSTRGCDGLLERTKGYPSERTLRTPGAGRRCGCPCSGHGQDPRSSAPRRDPSRCRRVVPGGPVCEGLPAGDGDAGGRPLF